MPEMAKYRVPSSFFFHSTNPIWFLTDFFFSVRYNIDFNCI